MRSSCSSLKELSIRLFWSLAIGFINIPSVCFASDDSPVGSPVAFDCSGCPKKDGNFTPTLAPTPSPTYRPILSDFNNYSGGGVDFIVAAFFLIAAGWLILALVYSILVLIIVRLRAQGELDVYDENFGRLFVIGRRCYIPIGCILRRYVVAVNQEAQHLDGESVTPIRFMTREERRLAMEELLVASEQQGQPQDNTLDGAVAEQQGQPQHNTLDGKVAEQQGQPQDNTLDGAVADGEETRQGHEEAGGQPDAMNNQSTNASLDATDTQQERVDPLSFDEEGIEPICSICLTEYEPSDVCFNSTTCQHKFHLECLLDWLERRNNTECPVCRCALVSDDDVWDTVQRTRRERRKQNRRSGRRRGAIGLLFCCGICVSPEQEEAQDELAEQEQQEEDDGGGDVEMAEQTTDTSLLATLDEAPTVEASRETDQERAAPLPAGGDAHVVAAATGTN